MRRLIVLVVLASSAVFGGGLGAAAEPPCPGPVTSEGVCLGGSTPGGGGEEHPGTPGSGGGGGGCRNAAGDAIPCISEAGGVWLASHQCYAFQLDPQPPAGAVLWAGHDPSEGSIWECAPMLGVPPRPPFFLSGRSPVIDAATVAEDLVKRAPFETANASIAPPPTYHSYVNYKNWMWIPEEQWHPVSVSVNAGGARVTLTATPTRVEWDMGNGEVQRCPGAGRVWVEGMPEDAPTTCSYTYTSMKDRTGDTWPVSARIVYAVRWTCTGRCSSPDGFLGEHSARAGATTSIRILQRQTVVIR